MDSSHLTIWTVGHSTLSAEAFLGLLTANGIEMLADIRRFPGSRRHPQFGADALAAALHSAGIGYASFTDLGGRRVPLPDSPHTVWRNAAFRGYADYMDTAPFREAVDRLLAHAHAQPTAVMCAESLWWRCHRAVLADYMVAAGVRVLHIDGRGRTSAHNPLGALGE